MASQWLQLFWILSLADAYVVPSSRNSTPQTFSAASPLFARDADPYDFSWIGKWAAIGDSFTAGIGSGNQLGSLIKMDEDWQCSRYDYSWPSIINHILGPSVKDFQFKACSGDRTEGIYNQAIDLSGPVDLVMMTAGGNDLCLADMIKTCVFLAWDGEDACQALLDKAQDNINSILKGNIRDILDTLNSKVNSGGQVIYLGYAPFFNVDNEDCGDSTKQYWAIKEWHWLAFWNWFRQPLALTVDRRKKFNTLVNNINQAISEVVHEYEVDSHIKYGITFADWGDWPSLVDGEMCSPRGDGHYPEPNQPELMFIKRNTFVAPPADRELKRDIAGEKGGETGDIEITDEMRDTMEKYIAETKKRYSRTAMYDSLLWKSANPAAAALHRLDPRNPVPAGCPSDGTPSLPIVPDSILANFHPNEKGHEGIAAYGLQNIAWLRAKQLGVSDGLCKLSDDFTCWSATGRKSYVSWDRLNTNYKDFCDDVNPPADTINWKWEKRYHEGTPEEHVFYLKLSDGAKDFDKNLCLETYDRIINSCDGNDPNNPLNFKFGGRWVRGNYDYQINPVKDRTLYTKTEGDCGGWYKFIYSDYHLRGRGWADWDYGQQTLLPSIKGCLGNGVTGWTFEYCDPLCDGYEWKADFNTPVFVNARCFENNKVAFSAGGFTDGCGGSDP